MPKTLPSFTSSIYITFVALVAGFGWIAFSQAAETTSYYLNTYKPAPICQVPQTTLRLGSQGESVRMLQRALKQLGYYQYPEITGYFGPATQKAVQAFQCAVLGICQGDPQTTGYGVVGPQTRQALQKHCNKRGGRTYATTAAPAFPQPRPFDGYMPPDQEPPTPSVLRALYHFDEPSGSVVKDSSGFNNHGILENGARRYTGTRAGNKLELDGIDDRVRVRTNDALNNLTQFTLAAWVRPTEYGGVILRKGNTDPARFNFGITYDGALYLRVGYSKKPGVWKTQATIPLHQWSHVAVTYSDFTRAPRFYINGKPQSFITISTPDGVMQPDTPYLYIGNNHLLQNRALAAGADSAFGGRMDKVAIYSDVLSDIEVMGIAAVPLLPERPDPRPELPIPPDRLDPLPTPVEPTPPDRDDPFPLPVEPTPPIPPDRLDPYPLPVEPTPPDRYDPPVPASAYIDITGPSYLAANQEGQWTATIMLNQPMSTGPRTTFLASVGCSLSKWLGIEGLCQASYPAEEYQLIKVEFGDGQALNLTYPKRAQATFTHRYQYPSIYTMTVYARSNTTGRIIKQTKRISVYSTDNPIPAPPMIPPRPPYPFPPEDPIPAPMPTPIVPSPEPPSTWPPSGGPVGTYLEPGRPWTLEEMQNARPMEMPHPIETTPTPIFWSY